MKMTLYAIKDTLAGSFASPVCFPSSENSDLLAKRWFYTSLANSPIASDCSLFKLGEYDNLDGFIVSCVELVCPWQFGEYESYFKKVSASDNA